MAVVLAPLTPGAAAAGGGRLMDRGVAVALATVIGGTLALQAPLNSLLGPLGRRAHRVGRRVRRRAGSRCWRSPSSPAASAGSSHVGDAPWWAIVGGGLISALYVASIVWTVRALGAGGLTAATIAGQFAVAMVVDHFGWLGVERSPITAAKLAGLALIAAGTWLVVRGATDRARCAVPAQSPRRGLDGVAPWRADYGAAHGHRRRHAAP